MAKSTVDDLLAAYRQATKLGRKHKVKLIALLTEDVSGPNTISVSFAHEPKKRAGKGVGEVEKKDTKEGGEA